MDNKFSLKKSFLLAKTDYVQWITDPKMLIVFVLMIFIYQFVIEPIISATERMGSEFSVFEPLAALGTSGAVLLILPLVFMVLMSDFPRLKPGDWYWIIRVGKANWLCGQLMFGIFSVISYIFLVFCASILPVLFRAKWSLEWSDVALKYKVTFPKEHGSFVDQLFPENLYNQMSLSSSIVHTYLLLFCYLVLLLLILLYVKLYKKPSLGLVISGAVVVIGTALCSLGTKIMWLFPMAHSVVWLHYTKYYREQIVSVSISYLYFFCLIALLLVFSYLKLLDYQFDSMDE